MFARAGPEPLAASHRSRLLLHHMMARASSCLQSFCQDSQCLYDAESMQYGPLAGPLTQERATARFHLTYVLAFVGRLALLCPAEPATSRISPCAAVRNLR